MSKKYINENVLILNTNL